MSSLAVIAGLFRWGEDIVDSSVQVLRSVPVLGLLPLVIIWFGIGEQPKVALVAIGTTFPIYINTYAGIRGVDVKLIETATTFGVGRWRLVRDVVVPGAVPNFLVGLRFALTGAWLIMIVAEQINAKSGLGLPDERGPDLVPHRHHRARTGDLRDPRTGRRTHSCACSNDGCSRGGGGSREHERRHRPRPSARSFDGREIYSDIDLDIDRNEFVALLGRSGTGKSTLLRALGGLDPEYDGSVLVPTPARSCSRNRGCCRGGGCEPTSQLGLPRNAGRSSLADEALAEVGLSGHAERVAGHAVGR